MNNNKKLLIYGSIAVLLLIIAVTVLFFKLSSTEKSIRPDFDKETTSILQGVPSDAIMIFDFKHLASFAPMLNDTSSFAVKLFDEKNPLVQLQQQLVSFKEIENIPFVYSLHYSSKNSVSFLQVLDLSKFAGATELFDKIKEKSAFAKRKYNNAYIYTYPSGLNISLHTNLILASNSSYVLESSIRHLENGTSILDNREFESILLKNGGKESVYINHRQIGKLFSGEIERRFLGYSDFFMQLSSWSVLDFIQKPGVLQLKGYFLNNRDEGSFSTVFYGQPKKKSQMGDILPANTIFALSLPLMETNSYLSSLKLFLEVQKKLGKYNYKQQVAKKANEPSPLEWVSSMKIEELVAAYCKFGEKCEWITFIREKSSFGFNNVIATVVEKRKTEPVLPFKYKGYIASVFGDMFAECNEEAFCKVGEWRIIGPKKMIEEFNNGNANYFSLGNYLNQTPAADFAGKESSAKIAVNIKEAGDSVLQMFKPYLRGLLGASVKKNNFEYATLDITPGDSGDVEIDISLYATRLKELPKPRLRENGEGNIKFEVDSTIVLSKGPFEVKDVSVKGGKGYLEQLPNMRLRYLDANKKGVWAIPFETPICGAVDQVDLFKNGKIQMVFISGDKLYILDRLGRFVRGYPVKLPKRVAYGPNVMDMKGNKEYTIMVLNEDNSISMYGIGGERVKEWADIKAPEFVKELPQIKKIGNKSYWILKASSQIRIYNINGKEIVIADKKKKIDRESGIKIVTADEIQVKGTDGKNFILNLVTGKTKKIK